LPVVVGFFVISDEISFTFFYVQENYKIT